MAQRTDFYSTTIDQARRRYLWHWTLWMVVGLSLGATIALAEFRCWLPRRYLELFSCSPHSFTALIGLLLARTFPVPLMFLAGLHPSSFFYTSHSIGLYFFFGLGVDLWRYLLIIKQTPPLSYAAICLLATLTLGMICQMLYAVSLATQGIRSKQRPAAFAPAAYFTSLLQCWGAMMLYYVGFYLIYRWFLQ